MVHSIFVAKPVPACGEVVVEILVVEAALERIALEAVLERTGAAAAVAKVSALLYIGVVSRTIVCADSAMRTAVEEGHSGVTAAHKIEVYTLQLPEVVDLSIEAIVDRYSDNTVD